MEKGCRMDSEVVHGKDDLPRSGTADLWQSPDEHRPVHRTAAPALGHADSPVVRSNGEENLGHSIPYMLVVPPCDVPVPC